MLIADERISVCNIFPDQAYLAGVFHDCGVPVLMQRFSTYCKSMRLEEPGCWANIFEEDVRFSADHCVIGYLVGRHWKLPDFICDAIRFHHDIKHLGNHAARTMVSILQLAIYVYCRDLNIGNAEWEFVRKEVLEELGIHEQELPELIDVVLERYNSAV
jgi:HD-like signal output (HDOD) protein